MVDNNYLVTIIYPVINNLTGTNSYTRRIMKGLNREGIPFNKVPVKKVEYSLFGKPVGGIISQVIGSMRPLRAKNVTHALSPEVAKKDTDIVTIHDVIPLQYPDIYIKNIYDRIAWKITFRYAKKWKILLASTKYGREKIIEKLNVDDENVRVVYHSVEHDIFFRDNEDPFPNDGKIHVLTVGDFNPRKKYDVLYKAIEDEKDFVLYHIGPVNGWNERYNFLKSMAEKTDNIKILGPVKPEMLRKYYSNADIFVYLSIDEGFGLPPLEAMACGTNVVVSDIPVFREVYKDYAFYTKDENVMETIKFALKNKRSENDLWKFTLNYSLENEINSLLKIYRSLEISH